MKMNTATQMVSRKDIKLAVGQTRRNAIINLTAQRDELLAVLQDAHRAIGGQHVPGIQSRIRAALAAAGVEP
jgi:hypothetical protein